MSSGGSVAAMARFAGRYTGTRLIPTCYVETYLLETWVERQRQIERFTVADHSSGTVFSVSMWTRARRLFHE